jgi:hypothetical protein
MIERPNKRKGNTQSLFVNLVNAIIKVKIDVYRN